MQSKLLQVPEPNSSLYSAPAEAKVPGFERVAPRGHLRTTCRGVNIRPNFLTFRAAFLSMQVAPPILS